MSHLYKKILPRQKWPTYFINGIITDKEFCERADDNKQAQQSPFLLLDSIGKQPFLFISSDAVVVVYDRGNERNQ